MLFSWQKFSCHLRVNWDERRGDVITLPSHTLPERWTWDADICESPVKETPLLKNISKTPMKANGLALSTPLPCAPCREPWKILGHAPRNCWPGGTHGTCGWGWCVRLSLALVPLACSTSSRAEQGTALSSLGRHVHEVEINSPSGRECTFSLWCPFFC